jgi:hypothetical protein
MSDQPEPGTALGRRLREIREELFGPDGVDELAELLQVLPQSLRNYEEIGELAPATVMLRFIELTGVDPLWLLRGEGPKFRSERRQGPGTDSPPQP